MKKNLCLCYCPAVVETDDSTDFISPNTVSSSNKVFRKEPEKKDLSSLSKPSFLKHNNNKSLHKFPSYSRRKIFSYKYFPRLFKAILSQDPVRNIQQLEFELKSSSWNKKDEKCFKKLDNHESVKPEIEVKEDNRILQEKVISSVSHESQKSLSSNWTNPNTSNILTSCDQNKKESCSLLYLIIFALFMTIFLGKYWAIVLTLSWLYFVPYRNQFFQQWENKLKSSK
ncbi:uncharacterized protein LOC132044015 [Lycium ferocissimum]|uniref:uncharacterized protein LOC132044015 n=1 Tax=Lycium ferocissimum TaxID=112874 RepID=UPI002815E7E7|nr:uncharacterized protein LOC132044015 [Lycium ferocissimum]